MQINGCKIHNYDRVSCFLLVMHRQGLQWWGFEVKFPQNYRKRHLVNDNLENCFNPARSPRGRQEHPPTLSYQGPPNANPLKRITINIFIIVIINHESL